MLGLTLIETIFGFLALLATPRHAVELVHEAAAFGFLLLGLLVVALAAHEALDGIHDCEVEIS